MLKFKNGQIDGAETWSAIKAAKDAQYAAAKAKWDAQQEAIAQAAEAAALKATQKKSQADPKKGHWGELSNFPQGGHSGPQICWRCGEGFDSKKSWKVWPQGPTCCSCRVELENQKAKLYAIGVKNSNFEAQQKPKQAPMKNGEIRRIPSTSSPIWTDQWAVMGTAKMPYVVSKKTKTGEWQCSCPDWTKHTPRTDCKHILKVKLQEGVIVVKEKNIFSGTVTPVQNQGIALPAPKGRKFR